MLADDLTVGQVVRSKAGRDAGRFMAVTAIEEGFVYLADGRVRKADKPKRKKIKHIAKTNFIIKETHKFLEGSDSADAFLRDVLKKFNDSEQTERETI